MKEKNKILKVKKERKRKTASLDKDIYNAVKKIAVDRDVSVQSLIEAACVHQYKLTLPPS